MGETDLREKADVEADVEMTPLIDIVFNLLIFFMTSMQFRVAEGRIRSFLPEDVGAHSGPTEVEPDELRVKLLWVSPADGRTEVSDPETGVCALKIDRQVFPTARYAGDARPSPDFRELTGFLREVGAGGGEGPSVIIDARTPVPWKYVVRALNSCVRAGVGDVTFARPELAR